MISAVFVDRPRLAIVISVLTTLAGLIAIRALPVAQFPDIVPPQVDVTAFYAGANAEVVEESVGQIIESEVNGVERMIYMRSTAGNDGSYRLSISFDVGSDPEANAVNVQNRVSRALSRLPQEVQQAGVTVKKKSSAILQVVAVHAPHGGYDELFLSNYATINLLDELARVALRNCRLILTNGCASIMNSVLIRGVGASARRRCRPFWTAGHLRAKNKTWRWRLSRLVRQSRSGGHPPRQIKTTSD